MDEKTIRKIVQDEFAKMQDEQFKKNPLIPVISGSRSSNVALTSLLSNLQKAGIIKDSTT